MSPFQYDVLMHLIFNSWYWLDVVVVVFDYSFSFIFFVLWLHVVSAERLNENGTFSVSYSYFTSNVSGKVISGRGREWEEKEKKTIHKEMNESNP